MMFTDRYGRTPLPCVPGRGCNGASPVLLLGAPLARSRLLQQLSDTASTPALLWQVPEKVPKNEHFNCDHCGTKVGASKYAAHLAKCMGHGGRRMRSREGAGDAAGAARSLLTCRVSSCLALVRAHARPLSPFLAPVHLNWGAMGRGGGFGVADTEPRVPLTDQPRVRQRSQPRGSGL